MKRLMLILFFLLPALALSAQGKRSVSGTILDGEGQPVIGAYASRYFIGQIRNNQKNGIEFDHRT